MLIHILQCGIGPGSIVEKYCNISTEYLSRYCSGALGLSVFYCNISIEYLSKPCSGALGLAVLYCILSTEYVSKYCSGALRLAFFVVQTAVKRSIAGEMQYIII